MPTAVACWTSRRNARHCHSSTSSLLLASWRLDGSNRIFLCVLVVSAMLRCRVQRFVQQFDPVAHRQRRAGLNVSQAADVRGGDRGGRARFERRHFVFQQLPRQLGCSDRISAGRAAAQVRIGYDGELVASGCAAASRRTLESAGRAAASTANETRPCRAQPASSALEAIAMFIQHLGCVARQLGDAFRLVRVARDRAPAGGHTLSPTCRIRSRVITMASTPCSTCGHQASMHGA